VNDPLVAAFADPGEVSPEVLEAAARAFVASGGVVTLGEYAQLSDDSRRALQQAREEYLELVAERVLAELMDEESVRDAVQEHVESLADRISEAGW